MVCATTSAVRAAARSSSPTRHAISIPRQGKGGRRQARAGRHALHLPDASPDRAAGAGHLPDLRHGARAQGRAGGRRRAQPRARRFHAASEDRGGAVDPAADRRHGAGPRAARAPLDIAASGRLDRAGARHAGGRLVRPAVLRARLGLDRQPQPQHVDADLDRRAGGLRLQPRRRAGPWPLPARLQDARRHGRALLRGRRGHRRAGAGGAGAGAEGARAHRQCHPRAAQSGAEDRAPRRRRRHGERGGARSGAGGRQAARAPRRSRSRRRPGRRGPIDGGRVAADGRAGSGREGGGRERDRRHAQQERQLHSAGAQGRRRDHAGPHRRHGGRGAAQPRADPGPGRQGCRLLRAGGGAGRHRRVRGLADAGSQPVAGLRRGGGGVRADHRLPVRAGAGHAHLHHGGDRARRARRRAHPECRGAGAAGLGRYADRRQDRHADRGQAGAHRRQGAGGLRRGDAAAARRQPGKGQRASLGGRDRGRCSETRRDAACARTLSRPSSARASRDALAAAASRSAAPD